MEFNNILFNQAMPNQQAIFKGNMLNQATFHPESLIDMETSWMENIDPLLRQTQTQESNLPWQQHQPLQRFITEPERAFFTARPLPTPTRPQSYPRLNGPSHAISALPQANRARMVSPSPSGGSQEPSQCSSARSPKAEPEWVQDNFFASPQDDYPFSAPSYLTQGLPELWNDRSHGNAIPQIPGNTYVNLNEVQGFPDPQEVAFEADEGYMDMDMKVEYAIEVDHRSMKTYGEPTYDSYRHSSDEGLGASIKDGASPPQDIAINTDFEGTANADADAEADEDFVADEPASDTEYTPKSTRTRKRRASKASSPPAVKRGRVTKPTATISKLSCKSCDHPPFKDAASFQRHVRSTHTRAFTCVFGFAGCSSTFASKNEWKRHVSSQHLNLNSWVCELDACGKVSKKDGGGLTKGSEFNRKDLFTQHLRRMHAPFAVKRQNKKNQDWEDRLKDLQVSCLRVKRQPPTRLACPLGTCNTCFEGASCWDDRMEHVGKHLEKAAASGSFEVEQGDDDLLVNWAMREHIMEHRAGGGYKLCGAWYEKTEDIDADADCEYD
jgi:hypothetical protein